MSEDHAVDRLNGQIWPPPLPPVPFITSRATQYTSCIFLRSVGRDIKLKMLFYLHYLVLVTLFRGIMLGLNNSTQGDMKTLHYVSYFKWICRPTLCLWIHQTYSLSMDLPNLRFVYGFTKPALGLWIHQTCTMSMD